MPILSPLMRQLRNELERCHPRFYHLANIVIEHKLSDLLAELTEDDPWIDQASQLTLLHFAAANSFNETIAYFLQQGVPINAPDKHGNTPLHYASLCGNEAGAKYLLEHGADKSISNQRGQHPWHVAYNRTLLALLYKGEGQAPAKSLYEAVLDGHVATVELLLQRSTTKSTKSWRLSSRTTITAPPRSGNKKFGDRPLTIAAWRKS